MSASLDIELTRQVFRPGDKVEGTAMVNPGRQVNLKELTLSLQGEEVVGAASLARTKILPLINEVHTIPLSHMEEGVSRGDGNTFHYPLTFTLPANAPPSYASDAFKCSYYIKGRIDIPWAFDVIEKLHITIVPYEPGAEEKAAEEFSFEEEGLRGRIELEKDTLLAGDTLTGVLHLDYTLDETPMAVELQVHAQERSLLPGYPLTRTIWRSTRDLEIKDVDTGYTMVRFEFPIPADAPFSHRWNIFEVAWELLVTIGSPDKKERREVKPLTIRRMI
jgi:hypothetical protein